MAKLPVKITQGTRSKTYRVEVDAARMERLAAAFGLFHPDFLKSVDQAERDVLAGRVKKIRSFDDLSE